MLQLPDGETFCTGRAIYADHPEAGAEPTAKIYVRVQPSGFGGVVLAQLDTGSAYSVLDPEIAAEAGIAATEEAEEITLLTRGGKVAGRLVRHAVTLLADDGDSLEVEATIFVPNDNWPMGRSFLGYTGFLERIRIAVDPLANYFYFGDVTG